MSELSYQVISDTEDKNTIDQIASWYNQEWSIAVGATIKNQQSLAQGDHQFQALLLKNGALIGTGGIYNHVGIINKEPRLGIYKHWLALMYTKPEVRGNGFGLSLCSFIQQHAKSLGIEELFLFTHTAESLYRRLGWQVIERLTLGGRDIVIMKIDLS